MMIYKSKGLEYEVIYFVGFEDGVFWNFRNQFEEDCCVFFVVILCVKEFLIFSFCKYRLGIKFLNQKYNIINEFFELF